ncbi:MAG: helix-turn-helix domain-containing protein [Deltaproteobacteria bacterium]|nr:helix-turn-helix domain-containing protein [Deltaproteobacteria bacterium]
MQALITSQLRKLLVLVGNAAAIATGFVAIANARELFFPNSVRPQRIYTVPEVARHLGISVAEVNRLIEGKQLKARLVGGRSLVLGSAIMEFLTS